MYSPLVPADGAPPVKIIIDGAEPGSVLAQALYQRALGEVNAFAQKARQARDLSGLPSSSMLGQTTDGGTMRYVANENLEVIHVRLNPKTIAEEKRIFAPIRKLEASPLLLIDVVFEPELYLSGDIFAFTLTGGTPPDLVHPDLSTWTKTTITDLAGIKHYYEVRNPGTTVTVDLTTSGFASVVPSYDHTDGSTIYNSKPDELVTDGPPYPGGIAYEWWTVHVHLEGAPFPDGSGWFIVATYVPAGGGTQDNTRDQISLFDTINPVGMIGDPDGEPYAALSTGDSDSARLKALTQDGADVTVLRTVAPGSVPPGPTGVGFVAQPFQHVNLHQGAPKPTIIDVYVASENTIKTNTFPGLEGSTFEVDDTSFTYDTKRDLKLHVRCRELIDDEGPFVVRVDPATTRRSQHFTAPSSGASVMPTVAGAVVDTDDGRDASWKFGAQAHWADAGGEPADPTQPRMGKLLAETTLLTKTVAAPPDNPRRVFTEVDWPYGIDAMTKVARIEWHPSDQDHTHGTATITPA